MSKEYHAPQVETKAAERSVADYVTWGRTEFGDVNLIVQDEAAKMAGSCSTHVRVPPYHIFQLGGKL